MDCICYRKRKKYTKYKLEEPLSLAIELKPADEINTYKVSLTKDGTLGIKERYTWDGPSGPALDTRNFMRASLVHDALYQLMRLKILDREHHRKAADKVMRKLCREDGMNPLRAWYCYWAVRLCAGGAAKPQSQAVKKYYAPRDPVIE